MRHDHSSAPLILCGARRGPQLQEGRVLVNERVTVSAMSRTYALLKGRQKGGVQTAQFP